MAEHLPVIFPSLLDMHNDNLLKPKRELYEIIPLECATHETNRKVSPELGEVEPVFGVIHDVLKRDQ